MVSRVMKHKFESMFALCCLILVGLNLYSVLDGYWFGLLGVGAASVAYGLTVSRIK